MLFPQRHALSRRLKRLSHLRRGSPRALGRLGGADNRRISLAIPHAKATSLQDESNYRAICRTGFGFPEKRFPLFGIMH
ncbi:hypothetical protein MPLSOD_80017 [Mesorhizobium sp. SOD10]|nr:hypothetical protein MPLSOD_80017 [Mesorhizobium sp. SOD10]